MDIPTYKTALIVGAGEGLSASLTRLFAKQGLRVALAARHVEKLGPLCSETGARAFACNASDPDDVERLFGAVERDLASPDVVVYNASARARGAFMSGEYGVTGWVMFFPFAFLIKTTLPLLLLLAGQMIAGGRAMARQMQTAGFAALACSADQCANSFSPKT